MNRNHELWASTYKQCSNVAIMRINEIKDTFHAMRRCGKRPRNLGRVNGLFQSPKESKEIRHPKCPTRSSLRPVALQKSTNSQTRHCIEASNPWHQSRLPHQRVCPVHEVKNLILSPSTLCPSTLSTSHSSIYASTSISVL